MPRPQKIPQYDSMVTEAIAAGRQEGATLHQICAYIASNHDKENNSTLMKRVKKVLEKRKDRFLPPFMPRKHGVGYRINLACHYYSYVKSKYDLSRNNPASLLPPCTGPTYTPPTEGTLEVKAWLKSLGSKMERYSEKFTDEGADTMALVMNVTGSDLKEWGVKKLHQRVINDGIAKLKSSKNNSSSSSSSKVDGETP